MKRTKSVMVVEDEPSLAKTISSKLTKSGYVVISAKNGQLALDLCRKQRPDIIVLDLVMPLVSGYEVLEQVKSQSDAPIVIISTNLDQERDEQLATDLGADAYLSKTNTTLGQLVRTVDKFAAELV